MLAKNSSRPVRRQRDKRVLQALSLDDINRLEVSGEWVSPSLLIGAASGYAANAGLIGNELRESIASGEARTLDVAHDLNSQIVGAWRLIEMVEQSMISETKNLWPLPPIWKIDAALSEKREEMLKTWLPTGSFVSGGDFISFGTVVVRVGANDAWHVNASNRVDFGSGLVSLCARLKDSPIHRVAHDLAQLAGVLRDKP